MAPPGRKDAFPEVAPQRRHLAGHRAFLRNADPLVLIGARCAGAQEQRGQQCDATSPPHQTPPNDPPHPATVEGRPFIGGFPTGPIAGLQGGPINRRIPDEGYGAIQAIDPKTGDRKWLFKLTDLTLSGVLSTASDLVFAGGREGIFFALDGRSGALLWKVPVGGEVASGPMSYSVGGRQYVAISAGNSLFVYALRP